MVVHGVGEHRRRVKAMLYGLTLIVLVVALIGGLFLVYRFNYDQWSGGKTKWFPHGGVLATLGLLMTIAGFLLLYLLVIPEEKHTEYRYRLGVAASMKGVADPLVDLTLDEGAGKKVTWAFPADASPLWVAVTLYRDDVKETFVRSGANKSFEDKLALEGVTKVTAWYGTPGGPSALAEWPFPKPAAKKPAPKP